MADTDILNVNDRAAARLLARFTEQTAIRRPARGLAGELLLADHEGDIVDPTLDPPRRWAWGERMPEWGPRHLCGDEHRQARYCRRQMAWL